MKLLKKFFVVLLAFTTLLSACTVPATSDNSGAGGGPSTDAKNPQTPDEEHLQTNTLHKVTVNYTNKPFIVNGQSDYQVVIPNAFNSDIQTAANHLVKYLKMATECELKVVNSKSINWNSNSKFIIIGRDDLFKKAGLKMPEEDIGLSGYYIKTVGNSIFVAVKNNFGYQRAVLSLLEHLVGYEMIWNDTVIFEKSGELFPEMEIIEKPDFTYYQESNVINGDGKYGMGFNTSDPWIPVGGKNFHNSFEYLPKVTFQKDHADWYSTKDQGGMGAGTQLCYTAHGNEAERQLMIEECARVALSYIDSYPNKATITLTQEDSRTWCGCDACMAEKDKYNGSNAAVAVKFINEVDNIVQAELQRRADESGTTKRQVNLVIFAYRQSEQPPVKQNADGSYSEVDASVKCNDTVGVYIAPIEACYSSSFYSNDNAYSRENIRGWSSICKNLYMWTYDTNFHHYFFPLNSYDSKIETYRFLNENNAYYSFSQSQFDTGAVSHFSRFKDYIDQKASFDVNVSYNELADTFFKHYFGPAEDIMRDYFEALQSYMEYLTITQAVVIGNYKENIGQSYLWPRGVLNSFLKFVDEAYESIEYLKAVDTEKYELYKEHILLESMFPRYALLYFYQSSYNAEVFKQEALQFKEDCYALGMTKYQEGASIDAIWTLWGV